MKTVTFYSYKGGTGRSLAVANAAHFLARAGKSVFVLDFDLEAPGLPYKLGLEKRYRAAEVPGLVDFLLKFKRTGKWPALEPPYVQEVANGIRLVPAGNALSPLYSEQLTELNLPELFDVKRNAPSVAASVFIDLRDLIETTHNPNYLLIDSRTGVTDIGGAAVQLLADKVICFIHSNEENTNGARTILRGLHGSPRISGSLAEVVLVLSRIPKTSKKDERTTRKTLIEFFNEPADSPAETLDVKFKDILFLHSEPALEIKEDLRIISETTPNDSIVLRDYWKLFLQLGFDKGYPAETRRVLRDLTRRDDPGGRRLVGGQTPMSLSSSVEVGVEGRVTDRKTLKAVPPKYYSEVASYGLFVSRVIEHLRTDLDVGSGLPSPIHWDLLAEHIRDGVFDFFGDPFYLTANRAHLVDIVQMGWCTTYTLFAPTGALGLKLQAMTLGHMRSPRSLTKFILSHRNLAVGVLGDTPAASEVNRLLSQYLEGSTLVSKGSEDELLKWLRQKDGKNPDKVVVCDHIVAEQLKRKAKHRKYPFLHHHVVFRYDVPVPVGFMYPREDRKWRRTLAKAVANGLLDLVCAQKYESNFGMPTTIEFLPLDELRVSLLSDMSLDEAATWNEKMMGAIDRFSFAGKTPRSVGFRA